jgi:diphthine-ammonia ligase
MNEYSILNQVYSQKLNFQHPPTRVCVETCLPENCHVILEAVAFKTGMAIEADYKRLNLHVQGISHWSPANIGPYSQSTRIGEITYISGQIGLIPGNMKLISGGIRQECKLILRHINRIANAMNSYGQLRDVVQGICFLTHPNYITEARRQWVI